MQFTLPRLFLNGRSNINSISLELTKFIFVFLQLPPELSKQLIPFTFSLNVNFKFENSKVLDLFSGVGSFGLECISRGTEHVTFVEKYSEAMIILKKNINSLNCPDKISIFETDILQPNGFNKFKVKEFDLIFLDPPFKETNIDYIIKNIYKFEILKKNGLILIHRNKISKDKFPEKFKILIEKKYGISKIIFGKLN